MTLTLESPGIQLTAQGVATEPGGIGEHIRVLNALSRTTVEAEITAAGQARVVPGTARPASSLVAVDEPARFAAPARACAAAAFCACAGAAAAGLRFAAAAVGGGAAAGDDAER